MTVVDAHLHLFRSVDEGILSQGGQRQAGFDGVLDEVRTILDRGRIDRAVCASALPVAIWRRIFERSHPDDLEARVFELAAAQNTELAELCATDPRLELAAGADASLPATAQRDHLRALIETHGVRALKIHPALNFVMPSDPGFDPIYELAREAGLLVISHGGGAAEGLYDSDVDFCAPENFAPVLERYPDVSFTVAHFAHPYVDELVQLAARFGSLLTDLSFVLGADLLPGDALRDTIRAFGVERVLFGTDFPYFDPGRSLDRLQTCGLSPGELELVMGANAERLFAARPGA